MKLSLCTFFALFNLTCSCNTTYTRKSAVMALPNVIVYKTFQDYKNHVVITLSDAKDKIVSYPDPKDMAAFLDYEPTQLEEGYWLDGLGLSKNTVFLEYTFEQYANLKSPPSIDTLMSKIISKNPFIEMYNLGKTTDFKDMKKEINSIIRKGNLNQYQRLI